MTLPILHRSGTLVQQVLLSGQIRDPLQPDQAPRSPLTLRLLDRTPPPGHDPELRLALRLHPEGRFAFFGVPEQVFPLLARQVYRLQLEASAPNYRVSRLNFNLGPIANQPQRVTRSHALPDLPPLSLILFTDPGELSSETPAIASHLPLRNIVLTLRRNPVRLRGRVLDTREPAQGVAGASVRLSGVPTPAVTNAQGEFEFATPLPLRLSLDLVASAPDFVDTRLTYEPNYAQPINTLTLRLVPQP